MATMACRNCGASLNEEAQGCPHCGADPRTGEVPEQVRRLESLASESSAPRPLRRWPAITGFACALGSCVALFLSRATWQPTGGGCVQSFDPWMAWLDLSWLLFPPALGFAVYAALAGHFRHAAVNRTLGLLALVLLVPIISAPVWWPEGPDYRHGRVKEGIHTIQIGVQSYAVDHNDLFPPPEKATAEGLAKLVDIWPTNPYDSEPMHLGAGPGDFSYTVSDDGYDFELVGYGEDGKVVIEVPW